MNYKKLLEDNKILNGELGFSGVYSCLSNFHKHNPITIRLPFDKPYSYEFASNNIETLFQAAKTTNLHQIKQVVACSSPGQAKRLGRKVKLREDWEEIKEKVMFARCTLGSFGIASKLSVCKNIASRACVANVHTLNHIPILNANMESMRVYLEPSTGKKPTCSVVCFSSSLSPRSLCSMD